jgi:hypothetical protein
MPDLNFGSTFPLTVVNENTSIGESAPQGVVFSPGTANANITIVSAGGHTFRVRRDGKTGLA